MKFSVLTILPAKKNPKKHVKHKFGNFCVYPNAYLQGNFKLR